MDDFEWGGPVLYHLRALLHDRNVHKHEGALDGERRDRHRLPQLHAARRRVLRHDFLQPADARRAQRFALLLITGGAIAYIMSDREFQVNGAAAYCWVLIWWAVLVFSSPTTSSS